MRQKRTDSELKEMAHEHVRYELPMMRQTATSLTALPPERIGERNVLIESFLLHTRRAEQVGALGGTGSLKSSGSL